MVPKVFIDGKYVGMLSQLKQLQESGKLQEMVAPTQADIIEAEEEIAAAEAPPLPTMADIAPEGFIDAP